jgi:hypothetical protein
MPIEIGKRQTIEEITDGRIKKISKEESPSSAGRAGGVRKEEKEVQAEAQEK